MENSISSSGAGPGPTADGPRGTALEIRAGLRWLGLIGGQATLLGAFLFYFGWVRTQSLLTYFGLDNNLVQLAWNDYVLRSPNLVIRGATLGCALLVLATLGGTSLWSRWTSDRSRRPWLAPGLHVLAAATFVLGLLGYFDLVVYSATFPFVPLLLASSALLVALGASVSASSSSARRSGPGSTPQYPVLGVLLSCVVVLCLIWAASVYATGAGRDAARSIEESPTSRPEVVIYSESGLSLSPPAVSEELTGSRYTRQYTGLRLLIYAPGRYLLIPDRWRRGHDPVYIIRDDPSIRVEIIR